MSTAIWQVDYHNTHEEADPVTLVTKQGLAVGSARDHTIHCRRDHRPTFGKTGFISNKERLDAIGILSKHLSLLDTWVGVFENRDVLSSEYMDRVALPFHTSQWYEMRPGRSGASVDHPGVDHQHKLIAKCLGIKDTVAAMEQGTAPLKGLSQIPTWAWWVIMALIIVVATVVAFL